MEINARMFSPLLQIYRQCLQNGDPVEALLNMGSNMPVKSPEFKGSYGMNSMITTYTSGRADELLDYNEVNQVKEIRPLYASTDNVPLPNGDQGTMLAIADITAESYQGVLDKYEEICGRVVKMPQWSPSF
ncbi:uncharacterized protein LOC102801662 [Saccoglossus kowalevskii]|uniref:Uncharacterized protein LOC102801662 n=1 Tax=Saccoglossus kowalevskii TaxID=10224 RepID=A0ABM0M2D9_SACKO|nr:PREDICTED: uncharacterized protein LOC102801662 [Saccoglossus kowalevskii]